jgi:Flp pilus assembly protein TadD
VCSSDLNRGNLFARRGEYSRAAQDYRAALKLRPDDSVTRHNLEQLERRRKL